MAKATKKAEKPQKALRKGVTQRLRELLTGTPTAIPEMMAGLEVDEAAVLEGLRRLGKARKGELRSGIVLGKPCWWWEPAEEGRPGDAP